MAIVMPGVVEVSDLELRQEYRGAVRIANIVKRIPKEVEELARTMFSCQAQMYDVREMVKGLKRCLDLSRRGFKIVKRSNELVQRKAFVRDSEGHVIFDGIDSSGTNRTRTRNVEVPLVFSAKLPAARIFPYKDKWGTNMSVRVPPPPKEAVEQLRLHGKKFDGTEVWWVPKDIAIDAPKNPDPIVVGVVRVPGLAEKHFELYRWIDENYEDAYWSREGY